MKCLGKTLKFQKLNLIPICELTRRNNPYSKKINNESFIDSKKTVKIYYY